uniref:Reverse transcriptase zinc-binding domain-containing protein n=1 Tax=Lactuca sativa TaxID=4236 RepID=A0A9R1VK07_LACSA|nr:hypothetical protein LSAT_V11C400188620 [Lactuca sativa]
MEIKNSLLVEAPVVVINTLEGIRRQFLWGACENKNKINFGGMGSESGELGVGTIQANNISLIVKWWCRFKVNAGDKTLFWRDTWVNDNTLKEAFPNEILGYSLGAMFLNLILIRSMRFSNMLQIGGIVLKRETHTFVYVMELSGGHGGQETTSYSKRYVYLPNQSGTQHSIYDDYMGKT